METWRTKAAEMLPEMEEDADPSDNPMALWINIHLEFDSAYEEPRNEDLIRRIYAYADWCLEHGERSEKADEDLLTCVAVCFWEHIPTNAAARLDMPRWFTRDDVVSNRQTFSYFLDPDEFEHLLALFPKLQSNRKTKRMRKKQRVN